MDFNNSIIHFLRRIPFRGKYRLLSKMIGEEQTLKCGIGNQLIEVNTGEFIGRNIYIGSYEQALTSLIKDNLKPGDTAVDCGANIGYYSLLFSELVKETGRVYSFEPFPSTFRKLKSNLELNSIKNVEAIRSALSDKEGKSLIYQADQDSFRNATASMAGDTSNGLPVNEIKMDDYIRENRISRIDFMKIDTDGYDVKVVNGCRDCIRKGLIKRIVIEFDEEMTSAQGSNSIPSCVNFLLENNYSEFPVSNSKFKACLIGTSADRFFVHKTTRPN